MQTLSEQWYTGAASTDILAAVHGARILCLLFSSELFILSICVTLSLHNVTIEMENGCSLLVHPLTASAPCSFQVSFLPFTHLSSHLPVKNSTSLLFGGWGKPTSSQLRDDRQSQLYLEIRLLNLFQELHSDSDCLTNMYCRLNFVFQPLKYKFLLHACWNPMIQTEHHHDYMTSNFKESHLEVSTSKLKMLITIQLLFIRHWIYARK